MPHPPQIVTASTEQIDAIALVMARASANDPMMTYVLSDVRDPERRLTRLFDGACALLWRPP